MNLQFSHKTSLGFILWVDNLICNNGQAFVTTTQKLFYQPDDRLPPGWVSYASPFKSWVCDSSIAGTTVPTSISGSLGIINNSQSGMMIDYDNGRVIFTGSAFPIDADLTGTFSFKEFNIYPTNDGIEKLIAENKSYINSRFGRLITGIAPYSDALPAVFINTSSMNNDAFSFGGLQESRPKITALVIAETSWQLDGVLNILTDSSTKYFPIWTANDPLGVYGQLISGNFNYTNIIANSPINNYVYVEDVKSSKISDQATNNPELYYGVAIFQLSNVRVT